MVHHLIDAVPDALRALQAPGLLDRIGAGAIGVLVLACWLFAPSGGRSR